MKKKIVIILVCTLLISTAVPVIGTITSNRGCTLGSWSELVKLTASDGGADDRFGCSADIDTYDAVVGAYFDDVSTQTNAGSAYVFIYSGSTWTQQAKLTASDAATDDEFGISVAIDGDYAIVGAHKDDDNGAESGSAYIFYRSGSSWSQQAKIKPGDGAAGDKFGRSVDIDGDWVIVGAPGKNSDQGFSYCFQRSGSTWTQRGKLGAGSSKLLGFSVSISADTVVMGAYGTNSNTGAAHIYQWISSSWYGKGKLTASDGVIYDLFGHSVSIDDEYIIIGAPGHDLTYGGEGATYVFEEPTTGWTDMTETQKITASDASGGDSFGRQVSIDGDSAIVSAPDDDDNGLASGSAYVFKRGTSSWTEQAKLIASDGAASDYFGWDASISGNYALVGAYAEDNGNGVDAGSAYMFEFANQPPSAPQINGPTSGSAGTSYPYTFTSTDPDGDDVSYYIKWGDGATTAWTSYQASGTAYSESHTWSSQGTYTIEAKAKDTDGAESGWGTLQVTIPRNRALNSPFIKFLQQFPNAFPILKYLLGL